MSMSGEKNDGMINVHEKRLSKGSNSNKRRLSTEEMMMEDFDDMETDERLNVPNIARIN